jgi:endonuclease YncB( thermonuclease family)
MEIETLYNIALKILIFSLVVGLIGILSGGSIFSSMSSSPITSDLKNVSISDDLENTTESQFFLNHKGNIKNIRNGTILIEYSSKNTTVKSTIYGLNILSEHNDFNVSNACYNETNQKLNDYIKSIENKEIILLVVNSTNKTEGLTYKSNIYLVNSEKFVGNELVKRGFAKITEKDNGGSELSELQKQAKNEEKGVWGCR